MYKLSRLAAEDFAAIYEYTLLHFGVRQADAYTDDLERIFRLLASAPLMGTEPSGLTESGELTEGIRRHDHQQHAIFYRCRERDIFVIRILHHKMAPMKYLVEYHGLSE